MGEIKILEYEEQYQNEVSDLILHIQQKEFQIAITKEDQPDLKNIPNFYQTGQGNFWVARYDEHIVGTIALLDIGNHQGALRKMFVQNEYRGKKYHVAQLLLQELINWSRSHEIKQIYLGTTEKFLGAHRFYEKNQFVRIDQNELPEAFPRMKVDTRFYKMNILD